MSDPLKAIQQARGIRPGTFREKASRILSAPAQTANTTRLEINVYRGGVLESRPCPPRDYAPDLVGIEARHAAERYADAVRIDIHLPARPELPDLGTTASEAKTKR